MEGLLDNSLENLKYGIFEFEKKIKILKIKAEKEKRKSTIKEKNEIKVYEHLIKISEKEIFEKKEQEKKEKREKELEKKEKELKLKNYNYLGDRDLIFILLYKKFKNNLFHITDLENLLQYNLNDELYDLNIDDNDIQTISKRIRNILSKEFQKIYEKLKKINLLYYDDESEIFKLNQNNAWFHYNRINTIEKYNNYIENYIENNRIIQYERKKIIKINFIALFTIIGVTIGILDWLKIEISCKEVIIYLIEYIMKI